MATIDSAAATLTANDRRTSPGGNSSDPQRGERGRRLMAVIAHRFGVISEASFMEGLRFVVQEVFGVAEVTRLRLRDPDGLVYGHPAEVEVGAQVRDGEHILIEVKSRVSRGTWPSFKGLASATRARRGSGRGW
ncbi:MAG: DUF3782 domain-containing protein [Candidatus Korarchaeota archaeon]|nr:DUF3782 domain-containing protein [Candidatus Korarchaeota archaeon]